MVEGEGRNPERCGPVLKDSLRDRRLSTAWFGVSRSVSWRDNP